MPRWGCNNSDIVATSIALKILATKCGVVDRVRCKPPLAKQDVVEVPTEIQQY